MVSALSGPRRRPSGNRRRPHDPGRRLTRGFHLYRIVFMDMNDGVKTAVRTVNLFEAFSRRKGPMTLTQLADALSAPISSCHGLVRTLSARGYLYPSEQNRAIYPPKRLFERSEEGREGKECVRTR